MLSSKRKICFTGLFSLSDCPSDADIICLRCLFIPTAQLSLAPICKLDCNEFSKRVALLYDGGFLKHSLSTFIASGIESLIKKLIEMIHKTR